MLRMAIPNKGRLSTRTLELLRKAGIRVHLSHERQLYAATDHDLRLYFVRADDVPAYVADGVVDLGVTGHDLTSESGLALETHTDLGFGACRLVVAVPDEHAARHSGEIPDGARIATSFPNLTRRHFEQLGKDVKVVSVSGATELTPHIGVADAIVDLASSGSTLAMNGLRQIDEILRSTARLITRPERRADPEIAELAALLRSVVMADGRRYVMANIPADRLEDVARIMPGIDGPTILDVAQSGIKAAHAVVEERHLNQTIQGLQSIGGHGILVLPIERLIP